MEGGGVDGSTVLHAAACNVFTWGYAIHTGFGAGAGILPEEVGRDIVKVVGATGRNIYRVCP